MIVGHPFDLVKVRLQTAERGVYTGALDVVRKTVAREGLARVCLLGICKKDSMLMYRAGALCWSFCAASRRDTNVYVRIKSEMRSTRADRSSQSP